MREDVLPALNMPVQTAAKHLGVSRQTLHRILAETFAVSPAMALRLGKFCGNGPELWLNMQRVHDLWHAQKEMAAELKKIPTCRAAWIFYRRECNFGYPTSNHALTPAA